jgi:hypothetical protein
MCDACRDVMTALMYVTTVTDCHRHHHSHTATVTVTNTTTTGIVTIAVVFFNLLILNCDFALDVDARKIQKKLQSFRSCE